MVLPGQYEGRADPLASVLAKSRLMSVGQEFRREKNETSSRISAQQPTDDLWALPVWSALSGRRSEASLRARLLSEDIRGEFAREQKLLGRGGCQIEAKMKRDDRVL